MDFYTSGDILMDKYRMSEEQLAIIEACCVPMAVYQFVDGRVVTLALSAGFLALFGLDDRAAAYALMDNDMYRDTHPDDKARAANTALCFARKGGDYDCVYRTLVRGEWRMVHARGKHITTPEGVRIAVIWYADEGSVGNDNALSDVLESEAGTQLGRILSQALRENAPFYEHRYDALTALPAMTYFFELASVARDKIVAEGKRPALVFLDLCGMKMFNRTHGFQEGDRLIRAVAAILVGHFGNDNCSRFAQDHFVVLTCTEGLEETLREIFEECAQANGGNTLPIRAGIYLDHFGELEISDACDRAKAAADLDRRTFVSCFRYYDDSMLQQAMHRQYILDNLDRAISEGWIETWYQPLVRTASGHVCCEEALARWNDPEKGMLSPAEFIPILEDAGIAYRLDLCVLEHALEKQQAQERDGIYVVPVSINLSRSDFDRCDIVEEIRRRVDDAGRDHSLIRIEITESMLGHDFEFMAGEIARFRALGFQVWMDDFGSGYSSLDFLQTLRFDAIKLDLRFMQKFDNSNSSRIILTELMKMALGLGIDTVAEGVETQEQADFLHEIGCTMLQGFFFCRPISTPMLRARIDEGRAIGFENPAEADYFAAIGGVNLYNPSVISADDSDVYKQYFDTIPMSVMEVRGEEASVVRCNQSYREMLQRVIGLETAGGVVHNKTFDTQPGEDFFDAVRRSARTGDWVQFDRMHETCFILHFFVKQIAVDPVTGAVAVANIVIAVRNRSGDETAAPTDESAIEREMHTIPPYAVGRSLASDYLCIYYINADTDQFSLFSGSDHFFRLDLDHSGEDFFAFVQKNCTKIVAPEDVDMFRNSLTRKLMMRALDARGVYTLTFRVMREGAPRYVHLKATRMRDRKYGILVGVSDIDAQMRAKAEYERARSSSLTYEHIARALSKDYISIYYVNLKTDGFVEYSSHTSADDLSLERESENFFAAARRDAQSVIDPDDLPRFLEVFRKDLILDALDRFGVFTLTYRQLMNGVSTYVAMKAARTELDPDHLIIGVSNVDAQMRHQEAMERVKEERITYARIAALSGDYIAIYTVDPRTDHYTEYSSTGAYKEMGFAGEGEDFFLRARRDGARSLYLEDLDLFLSVMTKENILETIAAQGVFTLTYRLMLGGTPTFVNLKAGMIEEKDGPQLIVGVLNVDEQVRRDQEYARVLSEERNKANFDALTGVKNKHAYIDVEARLNYQIEEGEHMEFALVVCDVNGLKQVNDTQGHQAGDRWLQRARSIICSIFRNSPVFRVGGDEFAVLIQGRDYSNIEAQMAAFEARNAESAGRGDITIAAGMARYAEGDRSVAAVFERADAHMYQNKRILGGVRE